LCGSTQWIEQHHVFYGPYRKSSDKYGMVVDLCHYCHNEPPNGVHHNRERDLALKREFQMLFEDKYDRETFMRVFGRNYL
jgi:hypothetical protein